jgi:Kef-type K+ transport system membrane component KefB
LVLDLLAHFSRQPLILAYLTAGFFIGPFGMGWVKSQESVSDRSAIDQRSIGVSSMIFRLPPPARGVILPVYPPVPFCPAY